LSIELQNINVSQGGICQLSCKILMYRRGYLNIELQNMNATKGGPDLSAVCYCITGGNLLIELLSINASQGAFANLTVK